MSIVTGKVFDRVLNYGLFFLFLFWLQTSICIKIVIQLQFYFTWGSSDKFWHIFNDVISEIFYIKWDKITNKIDGVSYIWYQRISDIYIIKNRLESLRWALRETKLKYGNHFDLNWSFDSKMKNVPSLVPYQKIYPLVFIMRVYFVTII